MWYVVMSFTPMSMTVRVIVLSASSSPLGLGDAEVFTAPATVKRADRAVPVAIRASLFHDSFLLYIHHWQIGSTFLRNSCRMAQST